jgi:predicted RNase H-like HicB family nuclease
MLKYPIEIFYSEEDEGYIALIPDLPGCNAWGETPVQALQELQEAAESWLEGARKMQRIIPLPSPSQFAHNSLGQFSHEVKTSESYAAV